MRRDPSGEARELGKRELPECPGGEPYVMCELSASVLAGRFPQAESKTWQAGHPGGCNK